MHFYVQYIRSNLKLEIKYFKKICLRNKNLIITIFYFSLEGIKITMKAKIYFLLFLFCLFKANTEAARFVGSERSM